MKKLLLTLIGAIAITSLAVAQHPKNIFGIRAGLNVASMTLASGGSSVETKSRAGFHLGISDQISLSKITPMYFETGLYLSQKGLKTQAFTANPLYLQIPALLNYHIYLNERCSIDPFAGFYYAFGVGGRIKSSDNDIYDGDGFRKNDSPYFDSDRYVRRSDLGLRVGVEISFSRHFLLGIGYETSLMNIELDKEWSDGKISNHSLTFTLGYNF